MAAGVAKMTDWSAQGTNPVSQMAGWSLQGTNPAPKMEAAMPEAAEPSQSTNPLSTEAKDLFPHTIEEKSSPNVFRNSCSEHLFGCLVKHANLAIGTKGWLESPKS